MMGFAGHGKQMKLIKSLTHAMHGDQYVSPIIIVSTVPTNIAESDFAERRGQ